MIGTSRTARHGARILSRLLLSLAFACASFTLAPHADGDAARSGLSLAERAAPLPPCPAESSLAGEEDSSESKSQVATLTANAALGLGGQGFHRHSERTLRPVFATVPSAPLRAPPLA